MKTFFVLMDPNNFGASLSRTNQIATCDGARTSMGTAKYTRLYQQKQKQSETHRRSEAAVLRSQRYGSLATVILDN